MAGKHSKNFFDFKKSVYVTDPLQKSRSAATLSLPFKIVVTVLVVSLLLSTIFISTFFLEGIAHKKILNNAKEIFYSNIDSQAIDELAKENSDIKGWIKIDGSEIDCAVCQGDNDQFYLNHNQLGKKSRFGALFLSKYDNFERIGNDRNIVIFGNNMSDGSMFGSLKNYRKLSFYKQHPFINLYYKDVHETYVVFAVMLFSDTSNEGETYFPTQSSFENQAVFDEWYSETCNRSLITTTVDVKYGDEFLTLVTSAKDFEGARLVVIAKKTDTLNVDVTNSKVNGSIKYPDLWYVERGLK